MEEAALSETGELACESLPAREPLKSIGLIASFQDLEEVDPERNFGYALESPEPWPPAPVNVGLTVAGLSCANAAYVMDFDDWVSSCWKVAGRQGFMCRTNQPLEKIFDTAYQFSAMEPNTFSGSKNELVFLPPRTPYMTPLTGDLFAFSLQHKLHQYVDLAILLINKCFSRIERSYIGLECDPETDEKWIEIDFSTQDEIDSVLNAYDKYTDAWVSLVPWPEREKIRISFDIEQT